MGVSSFCHVDSATVPFSGLAVGSCAHSHLPSPALWGLFSPSTCWPVFTWYLKVFDNLIIGADLEKQMLPFSFCLLGVSRTKLRRCLLS